MMCCLPGYNTLTSEFGMACTIARLNILNGPKTKYITLMSQAQGEMHSGLICGFTDSVRGSTGYRCSQFLASPAVDSRISLGTKSQNAHVPYTYEAVFTHCLNYL